jgi:tetratricopeptide (TPR) repeat protein
MAYVRQRGNQLAIVHGARDAETGKVEQQVLFTIHSRAEARELLGDGSAGGDRRFSALLEAQHPQLRFDWKQIHAAIRDAIDTLPEAYEYEATRLQGRFRADLCAFTRQLSIADPQWLFSAAQLVRGQRRELTFLRDLIDLRLQTCDRGEDEWNRDDPFFWRFTLRRREVPPGVEELASELYEKRRLDEAETIFGLLVECFEGYADGHNYLGLIALDRGDLDAADARFRRTIELGRRMFPRRIPKKDYWDVLETRPYVRGLRNLCLTLNRAGRYDEALSLCDRLERECGDDLTADAHRTSIHLNTGRWEEALALGNRLHQLFPEENLTAGLAAFELGRKDEARWRFLHGALSRPRAARMLLGLRSPALSSKGYKEVEDHNTGVHFLRDLHGFLDGQSRPSRRFFQNLLRDAAVAVLLEEKEAVVQRWSGPHEPRAEWRAAFDRMRLMETPGFAREQAVLLDGVGAPITSPPASTRKKTKDVRDPAHREERRDMPRKPATGLYYALKITLAEVEPPVWRRIVISGNRTLTRLNYAIQAAMGWTHSHLHQFVTDDEETYSDPMFEIEDCHDQGRARIKDVLPCVGSHIRFKYDFGDSWSHDVVVEQITAKHDGREPLCFDGERASPPEDVGGPPGFEEFLAAISDPRHERHDELRSWYAGLPFGYPEGDFDPTHVDFDQINRRIARPPKLHRGSHI